MEISNTQPAYVCLGHRDFIKNFASEKMANKRAEKFVAKYLKNETIATANAEVLKRKDDNSIFKKVFAFAVNKYVLEIKYFHKDGTCPDAPKAAEVVIVNGLKA